jgi:hypothetical protein
MRLFSLITIAAAQILQPAFAPAIAEDECSGNCVIQIQRTIPPHGQIGKQRVPTCYYVRSQLCPVGKCVGGVKSLCEHPDIPMRGDPALGEDFGWYYCAHRVCR